MAFMKTLPGSQSGDVNWHLAQQRRVAAPVGYATPQQPIQLGGPYGTGPYGSPPIINWPTAPPHAGGGGVSGQPPRYDPVTQARLPDLPAGGNQYWSPSFLQTPAVPYPTSPYAGAAGGGRARSTAAERRARQGGGYSMSAIAVEPSTALGPGAYWPGHSQEFAAQQQAAIMGIMAGRLQPDTRQPAQMAAARAYDASRGIGPGGVRMAGGGSYGRGSSGGVAGDFQSGIDDARQANEARYRDALEGYQNRYERNMNYLQGAGAQEASDINQAYDAQKASGLQSLVGRGLGNSTITNTMGMGYDRERSDSLGRLNERLRNQYLTTDAQLSGDVLGVMERRDDVPPDLGLLAQIGQLQGQGGGGGSPQGYQISMSTVPRYGGGTYYGAMGRGYNVPMDLDQQRDAMMAAGGSGMRMTPQQVRADLVRQNRSGGSISAAEWSQKLKAQAAANAENARIQKAMNKATTNFYSWRPPPPPPPPPGGVF